MLSDAMAQLVISQTQRLGGLALIPAVAAEVVLENRSFMRVDRGAQVLDRFIVVGRRPWTWRGGRRGVAIHLRYRSRLPRTVERIELDMGDRLFPVGPAVNRALDDVAQLAHVARPGILVELTADMVCEAGPAFPADFGSHAAAEVVGKHVDIALAHTQRRKRDHFEAQPVEQVGAKSSLL